METTSLYERNNHLLECVREGDREAGEELAILNRPLVYSIAGRFSGRGADLDDLIESGHIGLVKAMNTFDFERGCVFSTYATPLIFGEIRRFWSQRIDIALVRLWFYRAPNPMPRRCLY